MKALKLAGIALGASLMLGSASFAAEKQLVYSSSSYGDMETKKMDKMHGGDGMGEKSHSKDMKSKKYGSGSYGGDSYGKDMKDKGMDKSYGSGSGY